MRFSTFAPTTLPLVPYKASTCAAFPVKSFCFTRKSFHLTLNPFPPLPWKSFHLWRRTTSVARCCTTNFSIYSTWFFLQTQNESRIFTLKIVPPYHFSPLFFFLLTLNFFPPWCENPSTSTWKSFHFTLKIVPPCPEKSSTWPWIRFHLWHRNPLRPNALSPPINKTNKSTNREQIIN